MPIDEIDDRGRAIPAGIDARRPGVSRLRSTMTPSAREEDDRLAAVRPPR
jgi:hypothetical protein